MNFESKRKELEAAGYTISKSGETILKDGGTVAGINDNGNYFSGSRKVDDILKPKAEPKSKGTSKKAAPKSTSTKPKAKPKSTSKSTAPKSSPRPPKGRVPKVILRSNNKDSAGDMAINKLSINGPIVPKAGRVGKVSYAEWKSMTRLEREQNGLPKNNIELQNSNRGRVDMEPKGTSGSGGASSGFKRGGLVARGHTDYRSKGRFK